LPWLGRARPASGLGWDLGALGIDALMKKIQSVKANTVNMLAAY
jgi:hypothetical protein